MVTGGPAVILDPRKKFWRSVTKRWRLYVFLAPAFLYFLIFNYFPLYGIQLAFKDFSMRAGINGSPWAVPLMRHFNMFLESFKFQEIFFNTLSLSLYGLIAGFPLPILLAVMLNELKNKRYMKIIQNVTYAPHFISVVVMVGMINLFLGYQGLLNQLVTLIGLPPQNLQMSAAPFPHIYIWSGIWQNVGYSSIIYFAALSGVSAELHEAAIIDGASRLRRIWHINLPHIRPTIVILLILNAGSIMNVGFDKIWLMQTGVNVAKSEIIATYVYKLGIQQRNFSLASAVGLFNNIINLIMLLIVNWVAARLNDSSLF